MISTTLIMYSQSRRQTAVAFATEIVSCCFRFNRRFYLLIELSKLNSSEICRSLIARQLYIDYCQGRFIVLYIATQILCVVHKIHRSINQSIWYWLLGAIGDDDSKTTSVVHEILRKCERSIKCVSINTTETTYWLSSRIFPLFPVLFRPPRDGNLQVD